MGWGGWQFLLCRKIKTAIGEAEQAIGLSLNVAIKQCHRNISYSVNHGPRQVPSSNNISELSGPSETFGDYMI